MENIAILHIAPIQLHTSLFIKNYLQISLKEMIGSMVGSLIDSASRFWDRSKSRFWVHSKPQNWEYSRLWNHSNFGYIRIQSEN